MKVFLALCLLCLASALTFSTWHTATTVSAMPMPQNAQTLYCASDDGRRHYCQTDVGGGIQLIKQRSGTPCVYGQTWGYDQNGVWVDHGCRADFAYGYNATNSGNWNGWNGWGNSYNVYCASDDGGRNWCPVDTRGGVRLVRKRSDASCVFGNSWGYQGRGIWVDRGCRADFEIGQSGWQPPAEQIVECSSNNMNRNYCPTNTGNGVRIVRQKSDADCIYSQTWGYDPRGIWVDRGCRADFETGDQGWQAPTESIVNCSSDDMGRHYCNADTRFGVHIVRQRSEADCVFGRTWGYDRNGIWVDRGCRADFEIGLNR